MKKGTPLMHSGTRRPVSSRYPIQHCRYKHTTSILTRLSELSLLVIVDLMSWPMHWIEHLDLLCCLSRESTQPFGGLTILFEGDLYDAPPMGVVELDNPSQPLTITKRIFESSSWPLWSEHCISFESLRLTRHATSAFYPQRLPMPGEQSFLSSPIMTWGTQLRSLVMKYPFQASAHRHALHVFLSGKEAFQHQEQATQGWVDVEDDEDGEAEDGLTSSSTRDSHSLPRWTYTWKSSSAPTALTHEGETTHLPSSATLPQEYHRTLQCWFRLSWGPELTKKGACAHVLKRNMPVFLLHTPGLPPGSRGIVRVITPTVLRVQTEDGHEHQILRQPYTMYDERQFRELSAQAFPVIPAFGLPWMQLRGMHIPPPHTLVISLKPYLCLLPATLYSIFSLVQDESQLVLKCWSARVPSVEEFGEAHYPETLLRVQQALCPMSMESMRSLVRRERVRTTMSTASVMSTTSTSLPPPKRLAVPTTTPVATPPRPRMQWSSLLPRGRSTSSTAASSSSSSSSSSNESPPPNAQKTTDSAPFA